MNKDQCPSVKVSRTYYTQEKLRNMEENIRKAEWAAQEKQYAVDTAEEYIAFGVDNLLFYVTQQNLPRSYSVNEMKGCPVCGKEIDKFGNYPYLADPLEKPFKLTCPNCKSVFPSNDFASYYKSGLDEYGIFHYDKADTMFLVNELYPDKPSDWCVDNGYGWVDPQGLKNKTYQTVYDKEKGRIWKETTVGDNRFTFIAYFNHWFVWTCDFMYSKPKGFVTAAICAFRDAFLYTGDKRYADAGTVLLNRVADLYPDFDACIYKWEDNFRHSGGAWGKIIGSIWEGNIVNNLAKAYDAFFPAIDCQTVREICSKSIYSKNPMAPVTPDDIKMNIENNLLRQIMPEVKNHRIRGNVGMHQGSIALAALVLQNSEYFEESMDCILKTTDKQAWGTGNILRILTDDVDHDGCGNETSIGYNGIWLNGIHSIAEILKGTSMDLYDHPKFLKMFQLDIPYVICDQFTINVGDAGNAGGLSLVVHDKPLLSYFKKTGDVTSAQLLNLVQETGNSSLKNDLFIDRETLNHEIEKVVEEHGPYRSKSKNYSGFGLAKIELRNEGEPKCVWLYYGRNTGHGHKDTLMIGMHAFGVYLNPDHGYPALTDGNNEEMRWTKNTPSHDTVMVDNLPGESHVVGIPRHFHAGGCYGVIDVEAPLIYKQTSCYRRTVVTVNVENSFYIVDFFRIKGGNDHKYFFHGAEGEVTTHGLNLYKQPKGTYAGEDVEFASPEYDKIRFDGFDYLYDIRRDANVDKPFVVDWKIEDTRSVRDKNREVHLAFTMPEPVCETVLAKGKPPANKPGNPKEFTYMIARNKGHNISSCFTAVIEAYEQHSELLKIELLPVRQQDNDESFTTKALKITLKAGRIDYILHSTDDKLYTIDSYIEFKGFLAVISEKDGKIIGQYTHDAEYCKFKDQVILSENSSVYGTVSGFTKEMSVKNYITVKPEKDICPDKLVGKYVEIETDKIRNGFYEILSARCIGQNEVALDIGDITLIRCYKDPEDFEKGFVYNIFEGAKVKIVM